MKNKSLDPVAEWKLAKSKHQEFTTALPKLCEATKRAATHRDAASEALDRVEGDALIGKADDSKVAAARTTHDAARTEHLKAMAREREAIDNIARLEQMMPELQKAHYEARRADLRGPYEADVLDLQKALLAAKAISDRLRSRYAAAVEEFPSVVQPGGGTPYPVAAGLEPFAWPELQTDAPHTQHGGRLGSWLVYAQHFLDPRSRPAQVTGQMASPIDAPEAVQRREDGRTWY